MHQRGESNQRPLALHETLADPVEPTPDQRLEREEERRIMRQCLAELRPRYQEVLRRCFLNGEKLSRLARDWEVSEARVCQVRRAALKELRERMDAVHRRRDEPAPDTIVA